MYPSTLKSVLLVDDDLDHLYLCRLILRRQRYGVHILPGVKDIDVLLNVVREFRPSLIFMDHDMPGIGGLDATRMLKADPQYKWIPIIYFSGQDDIIRLAKAAGADECLRKSCYMPQLLELTAKYTA